MVEEMASVSPEEAWPSWSPVSLSVLARLSCLEQHLVLGRFQVGLAVIYLLLRIGQLAVHVGQDAIVHILYLVVGKAHLHGLLHRAGQRYVGHAVDALQARRQRVGGEVGQLVDVQRAIGGGHVHGGHHVHGDLHDVGGAGGLGSGASTWLMAEETFTMAESMSVPSSNSRNTMP